MWAMPCDIGESRLVTAGPGGRAEDFKPAALSFWSLDLITVGSTVAAATPVAFLSRSVSLRCCQVTPPTEGY